MKLSELIKDMEVLSVISGDPEITGIYTDTRKASAAETGFAFVCIKGRSFDGHSQAENMLENGAAVVFCDHDLGLDRQIIVADTREACSQLCAAWFSHPERELTLIGVTGTNGKTTISTVIKQTLSAFGKKSGLIGTCRNEIGDETIPANLTTPEPFELFELFRKMADSGCEYAVMEVSSQGLEQKRTAPCRFRLAVFTNLTQDHLDIHGSMENYYQAKKLIFSLCDEALINIDDEYGRKYLKEISCPAKTFSTTETADFYAESITLATGGVKYVYCSGDKKHNVNFAMPGLFNVSNSLAAIACASLLGFDSKSAVCKVNKMGGVRGRAEVIPTGRDFTVICDYAHTPDAVENVLSAIKSGAAGKVKCLFGCGGNRDAKKRPLMAKAAADNADFLIVTSDNPRNEDPDLIIDDIIGGLKDNDTPYIRITDRKEAIFWAIENAEKDDVIVLAGKGHEDYQILAGGVKIHFDEREIVFEALKRL